MHASRRRAPKEDGLKNETDRQWLPFLLLLGGVGVLFAPLFLRGRVLFWGTPLLQFAPWRQAAWLAMRSGALPLWNPWLGMGAPLLANYQSAFFYPPNWLLLLVGIPVGQSLLAATHLLLAGWGMLRLVRRLQLSRAAQVIGALAYAFSLYLVGRAGFLSINAAAAWLPWILLGVERLADDLGMARRAQWRILRSMLLLALAFSLQWLSGHAQLAWYSLLLAVSWAAWRSPGWRGLLRMATWLLGAGLFGFALAAVQLLPTLEYLSLSMRSASVSSTAAYTYSFWGWRLTGLLFPDLFGSPLSGNYWGYGNYWEDAIYIGILPLIFAVAGLLNALRRRGTHWALGRLLIGIGLAAFLLALGGNTPIYPWLFEHVPTFSLFQAPTRWNLLLVFALSLLAALGADAWRPVSGRRLYWTRLAAAGALALTLSAWLTGWSLPEFRETFTRAFALGGAWLFVAALLHLRRPRQVSNFWLLLIGLIVVLDLGLAGRGLNPLVDPGLYAGKSRLPPQVSADHRLYMPADLEYEIKFLRTFRFDSFLPGHDWRMVRDLGLPNTTLLDQLASANNFDPILDARYTSWMEQLDQLPPARQDDLLRLMDVGYVAEKEAGKVVYRPLPQPARLRLLGRAEYAPSAEAALAQIMSGDFPIEEAVLLEGSAPAQGAAGSAGEARIVSTDHPGRLLVNVSADREGWLLVSDLWYPGWEATVDDMPVEILRADYLFRAVRVEPGEHSVRFEYRPLAFRLGAWLSGLSWMLLALMGWSWRKR